MKELAFSLTLDRMPNDAELITLYENGCGDAAFAHEQRPDRITASFTRETVSFAEAINVATRQLSTVGLKVYGHGFSKFQPEHVEPAGLWRDDWRLREKRFPKELQCSGKRYCMCPHCWEYENKNGLVGR